MTSILSVTPGRLERQHISDLSKCERNIDDGKISEILKTLRKTGDTDLVRSAMIKRYAKVVKKLTSADTGATSTTVESYSTAWDQGVKQAIIAGQFEIVRSYLFDTIVRKSANLFTEPGSSYIYDIDGIGETMSEVREDGGMGLADMRWDALACGCGSAVEYLSVSGGVLQYHDVPINAFWVAFGDTVTDERGEMRPTNKSNIDEASVVVMALSGDGDKTRFAAWFGPSDKYENGRHCIYEGNQWSDIPDSGDMDSGVLDYTVSGEMVAGAIDADLANPLTLWAMQSNNWDVPTYPFSILYYDPLNTGILPSSTTLYETCQEFDLMSSMTLGAAGRGARGVQEVSQTGDIASPTLPENVSEGYVVMGRGWELSQKGWPASNAESANNVINEMIANVANSANVPAFLVNPNAQGEIPSGVALEIQTDPLRRWREARIQMNRSSVARRFAVERALINATLGTETIDPACRETWQPGRMSFPRDRSLLVDEWQKRIDIGEATIADMVKDTRQLDSIEAAINFLEEQSAMVEEHDVLKPKKAEPQGGTLAARIKAQRPNA